VVCIAETVAEAKAMFDEATEILDREANAHGSVADSSSASVKANS
jgi:hypothetical protein